MVESILKSNDEDVAARIGILLREDSPDAVRFRQWATRTLREYIQKGFVLNDEMLKNRQLLDEDHFDELLERIQEIRLSGRKPHQKIADVFEQCSYDYDKNSEATRHFMASCWRRCKTNPIGCGSILWQPHT